MIADQMNKAVAFLQTCPVDGTDQHRNAEIRAACSIPENIVREGGQIVKITDVAKVVSGPNPHHVDARKIFESPHAMAVVITLRPGGIA